MLYSVRVGCNYPLTQLALDEIKAAEQVKVQELVNKSNLERDNTIQTLQQDLKSLQKDLQEFERRRLRNPDYWVDRPKRLAQEVLEEAKRTGKDLVTIMLEKKCIRTDGKMSPRILREAAMEEMIALRDELVALDKKVRKNR